MDYLGKKLRNTYNDKYVKQRKLVKPDIKINGNAIYI